MIGPGSDKKNCTIRSEALLFNELYQTLMHMIENMQNMHSNIYKISKFEKYANLPNIKMFGQRGLSQPNYHTTKCSFQVYLEYCLISLHFVSKRIFPSWQNHSMRACWRACKSRPKKELSSVTLLKSTPSCVPRCSGMWFTSKRSK